MKEVIGACGAAVLLSVLWSAPGMAQAPEGRILKEDFPFEDGWYAEGIKIVEAKWLPSGGNAAPMRWPTIGQMSWGPQSHVPVEYFLPLGLDKPVAIVMVPGPGMTSEIFTSTPDGREGWAQIFAKAGYSVYVLNPGGNIRPFTMPRTIDEVWVNWGVGPEAGVPFEDSKFPYEHIGSMDNNWFKFPHLAFVEHTVPLLDDIGPAVFIGHNVRSDTFFRTLWEDHPNVRGGILIEPNNCPVGEKEDVERLYVNGKRALMTLWGDNLERGDPASHERLADCQPLMDAVNDAGGYAEVVRLAEDRGIRGNSNMMFMDTNSADIAAMLMEWIGQHVNPEPPPEEPRQRRIAERPPEGMD